MARSYSRVSDVFLRVLLNTPNHHITLHTDVWNGEEKLAIIPRKMATLEYRFKIKYLELFFWTCFSFLACHVLCHTPYRNKKYARKLLLKRGCSKFKQNINLIDFQHFTFYEKCCYRGHSGCSREIWRFWDFGREHHWKELSSWGAIYGILQ